MLVDKTVVEKKLNHLKHGIEKLKAMDFTMERVLEDEDIQDMIDRRMQVAIEKFIGVVGLRNILVHEYADIDYKLAYSNLDEKLNDLKQFAKEVLEFLEKQN